jgi:glycine/D-amino acid oxidase-like deaminating enzyme
MIGMMQTPGPQKVQAITSQSHGYWALSAPPPAVTAALKDRMVADVAIIGGGYTGLSAAISLGEQGTSAIVLEASEIGYGGSGRNAGNVNPGLWILPDDMPELLGPVYGPRLFDLLSDGPKVVFDLVAKHGIKCGARNVGTLHCAVGEKGLAELETRARQWWARGVAVELLDAKATRARVGTHAYCASLFDARAGVIQPLAYARGLAGAAIAAGASIYTRTPVTSLDRAAGKWLVRTPHGEVVADWVIVASNAYTIFPFPEIKQELALLPYFNISTKPLRPDVVERILPNGEGAWDTKPVLSSFRVEPDGRMIFGSVGAWETPDRLVHRRWVCREIRRLFPYADEFEIETEWYGQIGMTTDHTPRLHRFSDKVIGFSGYNGRGIAPGTVFGQVLAKHVKGEIADMDMPLPFSPAAPRLMRSALSSYYRVGAIAAHLI